MSGIPYHYYLLMGFVILRLVWMGGWVGRGPSFLFLCCGFISYIEAFGRVWDGTGWEKWEYKRGRCCC